MKEIWKNIANYNGMYKVSNLGNVKSLWHSKERTLTLNNVKGYFTVGLTKNKKETKFYVHHLVAIAFLNHKVDGHNIVVDHINNDSTDNRLSNLQLITNRENLSKDKKNKTSIYTGVSWDKDRSLWSSKIGLNKKTINLGRFKSEYCAHLVYQQKLRNL